MPTRPRTLLTPRALLVGVVLLALGVVQLATSDVDRWEQIDDRAAAWGAEVEVALADDAVLTVRPYRLPFHADGQACVAHRGDTGGSRCFVAGWQVETHTYVEFGQRVLVGVTPTDVATVRIPRDDGGVEVVEPTVDEAAGIGFFTLVLGEGLDDATVGNRITAHAADGTKLGNEHDRADGFDFGPWDGIRDQDDVPPPVSG